MKSSEQLMKSSQRLVKSSQRLMKSSPHVERLIAVLSIFRHDGFGSTAVLEESLHVVLQPQSVASVHRDDLQESNARSKLCQNALRVSVAPMAQSSERLFWLTACQFKLESAL
jgi:hypothetical protein